jgi:hypothetical protein
VGLKLLVEETLEGRGTEGRGDGGQGERGLQVERYEWWCGLQMVVVVVGDGRSWLVGGDDW